MTFKLNILKAITEGDIVSLNAFRKPEEPSNIKHLMISQVEYVSHINKETGKKTPLHSRNINNNVYTHPAGMSDKALFDHVKHHLLTNFGNNQEHGSSMHYIPTNHENWDEWHNMYPKETLGIIGRHIHNPDKSEIKHEIHHLIQPIYK